MTEAKAKAVRPLLEQTLSLEPIPFKVRIKKEREGDEIRVTIEIEVAELSTYMITLLQQKISYNGLKSHLKARAARVRIIIS